MTKTITRLLLLTLTTLSAACELPYSPPTHAATDQFCGGRPSNDCPQW